MSINAMRTFKHSFTIRTDRSFVQYKQDWFRILEWRFRDSLDCWYKGRRLFTHYTSHSLILNFPVS